MARLRSFFLVAPLFLLGACSFLNAPDEIDRGTGDGGTGGTAGTTSSTEGGGGTAGTGGTTTTAMMDVCGDGKVTGTEACDDGNTDLEDGCTATCVVEPGFKCDEREPSGCF